MIPAMADLPHQRLLSGGVEAGVSTDRQTWAGMQEPETQEGLAMGNTESRGLTGGGPGGRRADRGSPWWWRGLPGVLSTWREGQLSLSASSMVLSGAKESNVCSPDKGQVGAGFALTLGQPGRHPGTKGVSLVCTLERQLPAAQGDTTSTGLSVLLSRGLRSTCSLRTDSPS